AGLGTARFIRLTPAFRRSPRATVSSIPSVASLSSIARTPVASRMAWPGRSVAAKECFAGQLHTGMLIDGDDFDIHNVADFAHILDLANVLVVQFADMTQPITARQDFDEGPEILNGGHASLINLADAHLLGDRLDFGFGRFRARSFHVRNRHRAVILNVDL